MAEEELAQLLGGRAVLLPYTGPAPAVLANLALKVVANTLDFSQLVAERPDWSNEDPAELLLYVREQVGKDNRRGDRCVSLGLSAGPVAAAVHGVHCRGGAGVAGGAGGGALPRGGPGGGADPGGRPGC